MQHSSINNICLSSAFQEMYRLAYEEWQQPQLVEEFNKNFHIELPFKNTLEFESQVYLS